MTREIDPCAIDNMIDRQNQEIADLKMNMFRAENENIALATANSELRSEVRELKAWLRSVTYD